MLTYNSTHNTNKGKRLNVQPLKTNDDISTVKFFLNQGINGKRNVLIFLIGINTGLRCSDILKLKVGQVRETLKPTITEQKTGKKRRLNLTNLRDEIETYIADMDDNAWLFPSHKTKGATPIKRNGFYKVLEQVGKTIGRNDLGTHTMRKTFGYHYYRRTKDIATLMQIFNHSSEKTTKIYIGINDDEIDKTLDHFSLGVN